MAETRATIEQQAELVIGRLLGVHRGERVALVCDRSSDPEIALALADASEAIGAEPAILVQADRPTGRKNELDPMVASALQRADCLVGLTRSGGAPTYASAVKRLYSAGSLRGISMVMRTVENFTAGGALADYDALLA